MILKDDNIENMLIVFRHLYLILNSRNRLSLIFFSESKKKKIKKLENLTKIINKSRKSPKISYIYEYMSI